MYSTNKAKAVQTADKFYIEAGIHEDIAFDGIRVEKSQKGNYFIELRFLNKAGAFFTHTEYEPSRSPNDTDETFANKANNQFSRLLQLMRVFYDDSQLNFDGASFVDMANWVKNGLDAADKSKLMRVKIVYNDSGYTTLPKYAKFTFIEPMTVTKELSKIRQLTNIDLFVKPAVVGDAETPVTNQFVNQPVQPTFTPQPQAGSNLPF